MNRRSSPLKIIWQLALMLCLTLSALSVNASHFRFGHLTWQPRLDISPTTVDFTFVGAFRRNGYTGTASDGRPQIGDIIYERVGATRLNFGDGSATSTLYFEVIAHSAAENWVLGIARQSINASGSIQKTYSAATNSSGDPWSASVAGCCRITLGNSARTYQVGTQVDLSIANTPPNSNLPPIVTCPRGQLCRFTVPASDADGDSLSWRFSTGGESGIDSLPSGISIDSNTGVVSWQTPNVLNQYAVSVTIEDHDSAGAIKSSSAVDFLIKLQDVSNNAAPIFKVPPTPPANSIIQAPAGQTLVINLSADDPDFNDTVTLSHVGLPSGAVFDSVPGNPGTATLSWTPTRAHLGEQIVTFTAIDNNNRAALPHPIKIKVLDPQISDVEVTATVSNTGIVVDTSSFITPPQSITTVGDETLITWQFATFSVDQLARLDFNLTLQDPQSGETRLVTRRIELSYKDINGNEIRQLLPEQTVTVLPSIFSINVDADRDLYSAGETVKLVLTVQNLADFAADARVRSKIIDADGALVADLGIIDGLRLSANETRLLSDGRFATGNTYIGQYRVVAELLDDNGEVSHSATDDFAIVTTDTVQAKALVSTDKIVYQPNDNVEISDRVENPASNALLENVSVVTTVTAADGQVMWQQSAALAQLGTLAFRDYFYNLPLQQAVAGEYQVSLQVLAADGSVMAQSSQSFFVQSSTQSGSGVSGQLVLNPGDVLKTENQQIEATIRNAGNSALSALPITLRVVDINSQQTLAQWQYTVATLAVDAQTSIQQDWPADMPIGPHYAVILSATFADATLVLSNQPFAIQEKLTATLTVAGQGRLLVLLDPLDSAQCSDKGRNTGLSQLELDFRPDGLIGPNNPLTLALYDEFDNQVHSLAWLAGQSLPSAGADDKLTLTVTGTGSDHVALRLLAGGGETSISGSYRLVLSHWQNQGSVIYDSGLFAVNCQLGVGDQFGQMTVSETFTPDNADPFGPDAAPSILTQRRYLQTLLDREGWSYTLVDNAADFEQALLTGDYEVVALLHEQVKIPEALQTQLVSLVQDGLGLLVAGAHDRRNGRVESALGLRSGGKLSKANGIDITDGLLSDSGLQPFDFDLKPLKLSLQGATSLADYSQSNGRSGGPAIAHYRYGHGQTVTFGFDLLLQAATEGLDGRYSHLLINGLSHSHPSSFANEPGQVVPVTITLNNVGQPVSGLLDLTLPVGVQVIDPGPTRADSNGLHWRYAFAGPGSASWRVWLKLPMQSGTVNLPLNIRVDKPQGALFDYGLVDFPLAVSE